MIPVRIPFRLPRLAGARSLVLLATALTASAAPAAAPGGQTPASTPASTPAERAAAWRAHQQLSASSPFAALAWRAVGPSQQEARIEALAVPPGSHNTIYAGPGAGNVWKSTNNGLTWAPIFEHESSFAIGDIAIAPSNGNIVWVGTGEVQPRHSGYAYAGTGVFKSTDAGATWTHVGLDDTQHIGKIVIDPSNPEVVYVAAMGHFWSRNDQRGVFKTTDGGRTWTRSLFIDDTTGAIDVAIDPSRPSTLYASVWQFTSGPESGVYRTTDAGATWTKLTDGLPAGPLGRSNVDIAPSRPDTVYVFLDNQTRVPPSGDRTVVGGEVYRSDDRGETWHKANTDDLYPVFGIYGWKFCDIRVSPDNPDEIYVLGNRAFHSTDGGRTYRRIGETIRRLHDTDGLVMHLDHHELWIDPADASHLLLGNDGGVFASYDRGESWLHLNTIPVAQFYSIAVDMAEPYNIYGGTQDDAALYGPSTYRIDDARNENEPWRHVYLDQWTGGDSFVTLPDPTDPHSIYYEHQNGDMRRMDTSGASIQTGSPSSTSIRPRAPRGQPPYRFGWFTPFVISHFDERTLYAGANRLLKSTNRGTSWTPVSPDLSDAAGGERAVVPYGTITMIAESPLDREVVWIGTEGGHVHVTRDGGATWTSVSTGLPAKWISRVTASAFDRATAYVSATGFREDDFRSYLFRTTDFGRTWTSISGNLPAESINVIREDPSDRDILYAGTDAGVYVSIDRGGTWLSLSTTLPTTPVHDLVVHPRDHEIVIGTHGRGIFIADARPVQGWARASAAAEPVIFEPHPALVRIQDEIEPAGTAGLAELYFTLPGDGPVSITIRNASGTIARQIDTTGHRGLNRATWDLMSTVPAPPGGGEAARRAAAPGVYQVQIASERGAVEGSLRLNPFVRWRK